MTSNLRGSDDRNLTIAAFEPCARTSRQCPKCSIDDVGLAPAIVPEAFAGLVVNERAREGVAARAYAPVEAIVLNPLIGSGTVLIESARPGCAADGNEVNPAACLLDRVDDLCCHDQDEIGDVRVILLPDRSINAVLTSPLYINGFNDRHNSRDDIERPGWKPLVVARAEIGSNRTFRQNRFFPVVQYCIDRAMPLAEISRLCCQDARRVLNLERESNVHKTPFLSAILKRLAHQVVGMNLCQQQERFSFNQCGQHIDENLLCIPPAQRIALTRETVVEQARAVGNDVFVKALDRVPSDRRHYLRPATNFKP